MHLIRFRSLISPAALLNITGIAVAIAAFYIIMSIVATDLTFDHSIKNYKNVYLLSNHLMQTGSYDRLGLMNRAIGEQLKQRIPSVIHSGCVKFWNDNTFLREENGEMKRIKISSLSCSKGLFDVFSFEFIEGDTSKFFGRNTMVINQKAAQKFNLRIGDFLVTDNGGKTEIVAIFKDFAKNTHLGRTDAFVGLGKEDIDNINQWSYSYFLMLHDNADLNEFNKEFNQIAKEAFLTEEDTFETIAELDKEIERGDVKLISLNDLHFQKRILGHHIFIDPKFTYTMLILAVVIILIAYINYFNFFVARIPDRIRSINTRKILGSSRASLVWSLIAESLIYTLLGAVLAYFIQKYAGTLLSQYNMVDADAVLNGNYLIGILTVGLACIASVIATLYPALHITSISPALAIRGRITSNHDNVLRYILIGCQIAASLATIIGTTFISLNNNFLITRDMGFNRNNLYVTPVTQKISQNPEDIESLLRQNAAIADITWASNPIVNISSDMRTVNHPVNENERFEYNVLNVSPNFFEFMDLELVEGDYPTKTDGESNIGAAYFNENARNRYNLTTEISLNDNPHGKRPIKGFVKDFNFLPLQYGIQPIGLFVHKTKYFFIYLRFAPDADVAATKKFVETTLNDYDPVYTSISELEVQSFTQQQEQLYGAEKQVSAFITIFTVITIIVSVIGIFGIVMFDTQRRRKEIGIRRVNGATITEILLMFNKKFFILVGICAAVAVPVALVALNKYFSGFAYHIPIHWYVIAICIIAALFITALTVTLASFRAATENPSNTLKTE